MARTPVQPTRTMKQTHGSTREPNGSATNWREKAERGQLTWERRKAIGVGGVGGLARFRLDRTQPGGASKRKTRREERCILSSVAVPGFLFFFFSFSFLLLMRVGWAAGLRCGCGGEEFLEELRVHIRGRAAWSGCVAYKLHGLSE